MDNEFNPGMYDSTFKEWMKKGMTAFCTVTKNGDLRSFQDLKDRFALRNQDLFRYLQLRDYYNKKLKREALEENNRVIEVIVNAYH